MFAIVDIETTGGFAGANNITEIAIVLHNGKAVEGRFSTLVNPLMPIQKFVQGLTGITDAMVAEAPTFNAVAPNIYNLIKDRIFVAHNVNFDYSFVQNELKLAGYNLDTQKLCTIRLTKKVFPNLPKYGLGTVCRELNIQLENRHRAAGDAMATALLFSKIIEADTSGEMAKMIKKKFNQYLPPNLNATEFENLPSTCGIYYFLNKFGKVVYVGKAKNIAKRVASHFSNNKITKQKQDFLREIYSIQHTLCENDLVASILESIEIKRVWPAYNKSQKYYQHQYGIYLFSDSKGYIRLGIDKQKKLLKPILNFSLMVQAQSVLRTWISDFNLHPALCFIDNSQKIRTDLPTVEAHEAVVKAILDHITEQKKSYIIQEQNNFYILVVQDIFYGMGKIEDAVEIGNTELLKSKLTAYPENETIKATLKRYVSKYPEKVLYC